MKNEFELKSEFILTLGRSLHSFGAAAQHIETAMQVIAKKLCNGGQFFVTPTAVFCSIKRPDGSYDARMLRVSPQSIDLGKLSLVDELTDKMLLGKIPLKETLEQLEMLSERKRSYEKFLYLPAFIFASSSFCLLFSGTIKDIISTAAIGLIVYFLIHLFSKFSNFSNALEFIIAFSTTIIAGLFTLVEPTLNLDKIILASLIILIPGLSFTIALTELSTKNLMAGTARLMGSVMELLKIAFGVLLGKKIITLFIEDAYISEAISNPLNFYLESFLVSFALLSFCILFKSRIKDWFWIVLLGTTAYLCAKFGRIYFGEELGVFIGGTSIALLGNGFARFVKRPALTILIPSLIPMVPGSIGYESVSFLLNLNVIESLNRGFSMISLAMALVAGLAFGHILINPGRSM